MSVVAPGVGLCAVLALVAYGAGMLQQRMVGHPLIEPLVVALLLGILVRAAWALPRRAEAGVAFTARPVLEVAVALMGATVDLPLLARAGPAVGLGIVAVVVVALPASYALGRGFGLPHRLALLVAAGNAICGNSAIAAVAPVIGADADEVASSIAFTAVFGVVMVLALPATVGLLSLSAYQYGVLAGLTVYAVPQVLAAAYAVGPVAGDVGTLVKLVRVLMLGPVVVVLALVTRRDRATRGALAQAVPWFIVAFVLVAALRAGGVLPASWIAPLRMLSQALTVLAMAALGLGCDVRALARAGRPMVSSVVTSLAVLLLLSLALIRGLAIA